MQPCGKTEQGTDPAEKQAAKKVCVFQSDTFSATQVVVLAWQEGVSEQGSEGLEVEWHLLELTEQPCLQILNCALKDVLSCLLSLVFRISLNRQGKVQKRGKNFIHFMHA